MKISTEKISSFLFSLETFASRIKNLQNNTENEDVKAAALTLQVFHDKLKETVSPTSQMQPEKLKKIPQLFENFRNELSICRSFNFYDSENYQKAVEVIFNPVLQLSDEIEGEDLITLTCNFSQFPPNIQRFSKNMRKLQEGSKSFEAKASAMSLGDFKDDLLRLIPSSVLKNKVDCITMDTENLKQISLLFGKLIHTMDCPVLLDYRDSKRRTKAIKAIYIPLSQLTALYTYLGDKTPAARVKVCNIASRKRKRD